MNVVGKYYLLYRVKKNQEYEETRDETRERIIVLIGHTALN